MAYNVLAWRRVKTAGDRHNKYKAQQKKFWFSRLKNNQWWLNSRYHMKTCWLVENTDSLLSLLCYPLRSHVIIFTHRHSIAERGGCFQWRLFVCQFVNRITHERLNIGWWNLAVRWNVQKSRLSSNVKVTSDKKWKPAVHGIPYAAHSSRWYQCVAARRW